jgi:hypothetical protein
MNKLLGKYCSSKAINRVHMKFYARKSNLMIRILRENYKHNTVLGLLLIKKAHKL